GVADLEGFHGLDAAVVSHLHRDHLDVWSLRRVEPKVIVLPRGGGRMLRRRRFPGIVELDRDEETHVGAVTIRATYAEHDDRRGLFGLRAPALGYVLEGSARVYFAGDTDL